jgi:hypothetical protein
LEVKPHINSASKLKAILMHKTIDYSMAFLLTKAIWDFNQSKTLYITFLILAVLFLQNRATFLWEITNFCIFGGIIGFSN